MEAFKKVPRFLSLQFLYARGIPYPKSFLNLELTSHHYGGQSTLHTIFGIDVYTPENRPSSQHTLFSMFYAHFPVTMVCNDHHLSLNASSESDHNPLHIQVINQPSFTLNFH